MKNFNYEQDVAYAVEAYLAENEYPLFDDERARDDYYANMREAISQDPGWTDVDRKRATENVGSNLALFAEACRDLDAEEILMLLKDPLSADSFIRSYILDRDYKQGPLVDMAAAMLSRKSRRQ